MLVNTPTLLVCSHMLGLSIQPNLTQSKISIEHTLFLQNHLKIKKITSSNLFFFFFTKEINKVIKPLDNHTGMVLFLFLNINTLKNKNAENITSNEVFKNEDNAMIPS
ncbi:hypothetical protein CsSME_00046024 [Camellia sinensis var. sinensis]